MVTTEPDVEKKNSPKETRENSLLVLLFVHAHVDVIKVFL